MPPADIAITDALATDALGKKCDECGHRGGWHRGPLADLEACSQFDPANPRPERQVP